MIIDFHTHVPVDQSGNLGIGPEEFIESMNKAKIDCSIILGVDTGLENGQLKDATDLTDEKVANFCSFCPERLIGFASINPNRPAPYLKVKYALEVLGLSGVKLYPHRGFFPNDHRLWDIYKLCQDLNVPVMIHTGIKVIKNQKLIFNSPVYVDDVAVAFPNLKIIMCHGGYPWIEEYLTVVFTNPNVWVDITFLGHIEKAFGMPGFTHDYLKRLVSVIGSKRIVWGTEGPQMDLPLYNSCGLATYFEMQDFLVNRMEFLSETDKKDILGNNALRLLGKSY